MSMCIVFSCVFGRGCLLWPVSFLGKTLLAFANCEFYSVLIEMILLILIKDNMLTPSQQLCWDCVYMLRMYSDPPASQTSLLPLWSMDLPLWLTWSVHQSPSTVTLFPCPGICWCLPLSPPPLREGLSPSRILHGPPIQSIPLSPNPFSTKYL